MHPDAIAYLHLGDSQESEQEIYPFISVKGNNDYLINDEIKILHIENLNIFMTHGHRMYLSKDNMLAKAKANKCNMFLFGHTHRPYYEFYEGVHILNPGSLTYPRSVLNETYAIINIDDENVDVQIVQFD